MRRLFFVLMFFLWTNFLNTADASQERRQPSLSIGSFEAFSVLDYDKELVDIEDSRLLDEANIKRRNSFSIGERKKERVKGAIRRKSWASRLDLRDPEDRRHGARNPALDDPDIDRCSQVANYDPSQESVCLRAVVLQYAQWMIDQEGAAAEISSEDESPGPIVTPKAVRAKIGDE